MAISPDQRDDLAGGALQGDRAAMHDLFDSLVPRLYRQFQRVTNDPALTEQAICAAWDDLVASLPTRAQDQFSALLRTIICNCARRVVGPSAPGDCPPDWDAVFASYDQAEPIGEMPAALERNIHKYIGRKLATAHLVSPILPFPPTSAKLRTLAVMFTDLEGSTAYSEKYGGQLLLEKLDRHNELLEPLIKGNGGKLIRMRGDGSLSTFESASDAAECAVAAQRQLAAYNADPTNPHLERLDAQIHIRIGIDHGKVVEYRARHGPDLVGRAVNSAARVVDADKSQLDQILVSDAVVNELGTANFATTMLRTIKARGIGLLTLHRLHWREAEVSDDKRTVAVAPGHGRIRTRGGLSATRSAGAPPSPPVTGETGEVRAVHCAFVDSRSGHGRIVPIRVRVSDSPTSIRSVSAWDRGALSAAEEAVRSAYAILDRLGIDGVSRGGRVVECLVDDPAQLPEGAPVGTAITLATVAAVAGIDIDPGTLVCGDFAEERDGPSAKIGEKWASIRSSGRFHTLVVPSGRRAGFPEVAFGEPGLRIIEAPSVLAAVVAVLGPALGVSAYRLDAALGGDKFKPELWARSAKSSPPGAISGVSGELAVIDSWKVGDCIQVFARASSDCHLAILHVDALETVRVLLPNENQPSTATPAQQVICFPEDGNRFEHALPGPPGWQRLIALATSVPVRFLPADMEPPHSAEPATEMSLRDPGDKTPSQTSTGIDSVGGPVCAPITMGELVGVINELKEGLLGSNEIRFYVSEQEEQPVSRIRTRGASSGQSTVTRGMSAISKVDDAGFLSMELK
jgi:class 3 adenylate cyclase